MVGWVGGWDEWDRGWDGKDDGVVEVVVWVVDVEIEIEGREEKDKGWNGVGYVVGRIGEFVGVVGWVLFEGG